jgi:hypothetical protein
MSGAGTWIATAAAMTIPGSNRGGTPAIPPPAAAVPVSADEQRERFLARKKAMLARWVARLNVLKNNAAYRAIERRVNKMLGEVEREEKKSGASSTSLEKQIDTWLAKNAGKVGGPEQEQDPARPHSPGWHGERPPNPVEQR